MQKVACCCVGSFKSHASIKSVMQNDCKNLFDRFLDQYKGREVPVNKMVDSNYKANVKRSQSGNCSYSRYC